MAAVIVTRAAEQADELARELDHAGLDPVLVPTIAIEFVPPGGELDLSAHRLHTYQWVVITSANGARAILAAALRGRADLETPRWAVIGPATRRVLEREGIAIDLQPSQSSAARLVVELPVRPGDRILVVRGDLADDHLALALRDRGAEVDDVVAYRTREAPESSRPLLRRAMGRPIAGVVFTSGSSVRGLVALGRAESVDVVWIPSVCIGPKTTAAARAAGFGILGISPSPRSAVLAATTAKALAIRSKETP